MPRPRLYADEKQKRRAAYLRLKAKRDTEKSQCEQIPTIKGLSRYGDPFSYEKPKGKVEKHGGRDFTILVITFRMDIHDLAEMERGLNALADAHKSGYKTIAQENITEDGYRFARHTLSKKKR